MIASVTRRVGEYGIKEMVVVYSLGICYGGGGSKGAGKRFLDLQSAELLAGASIAGQSTFSADLLYTLSLSLSLSLSRGGIRRGNHTAIVHEPVPD